MKTKCKLNIFQSLDEDNLKHIYQWNLITIMKNHLIKYIILLQKALGEQKIHEEKNGKSKKILMNTRSEFTWEMCDIL